MTQRLALGGMAELFLGEVSGAHGFAKTVVIKRILPHLVADEQFTSMFISEAKITARLDHPKIAQTYELGTQDGQLFIAMEYVDGLDVLAMLRECARRRVHMPAEIAVFIVKETLDALDFAHKQLGETGAPLGIVHRDVSPSNILISRRGDVKLVDFGIAHAATQETKTQAGTLKGKYGYMSPEQVLGQPVTPKSDIFAAGVVLAEMLMGRRLFAAPNELDVLLMVRDVDLGRLDRFGKQIEDKLASLVRWALRKDPADRYADAGTFREALDEWLFENRHRVTTAHIAEVVESLYADAADRRKQLIDEAERSGNLKLPAPAGMSDPAPAERASKAAEAVVVTKDAAPRAIEIAESGGIEVHLDDMDAIDVDLDESEVARAEVVDAVAGARVPVPDSFARIEDIDLVIDRAFGDEPDSIEISIGEAPLVATPMGRLGISRSFDTISAAVASVAPAASLSRDPASRDFDDTDVSGLNEPKPRRMPTAEELAHTPRPQPVLSEPIGEPEGEGELRVEPALAVLYRTTATRATGLLVLSVGGMRKEIYFKRGMPEFVSSNVASELFGAYLVREEVLSSGELDMALAVMPHFGGKLGDTLVGLGLMKPLEVFRHLMRQVRKKLIEVCTWTSGHYHWYPGTEHPRSAFPLDLDPFEVYGAGAMETPRPALQDWFETRVKLCPVAVRSTLVVPELFQNSKIVEVHAALDGTRSVADFLAAAEDAAGLDVLRALFLLLNTKLATDVSAVAAGT